MKKTAWCLVIVSLILMNSCLGVEADISVRADGSGKINLEYRVSQMLESLGRLDGNERWPSIPVGRADFERTVARIQGLSLLSYSSKEVPSVNNVLGGRDLLTKVSLEFKDVSALSAFWGSGSAGSSAGNILRLVLLDLSSDTIDEDLLALLKEISAGYEISFSLSAPKNAALSLSPSVSSARVVTQGKKVSFAIGMGDLLDLKDGLAVEISW
ncbi:MAG: hypothetical protein LBI28_14700 [Treponema sp.]|jgi:hypothetical protein|nr:hypothetical protein [Treponema sp.]